VYATDVTAAVADKLRVLPLAVKVQPRYEVAVLTDSAESTLGAAFVAELLGPGGQTLLVQRGFLLP